MPESETTLDQQELACKTVHELAWKLVELTNPLLEWEEKEICKVRIQLQQALQLHKSRKPPEAA